MSLSDAGLVLPAQRSPRSRSASGACTTASSCPSEPGIDQRVSQRIWLFKNRATPGRWLRRPRRTRIQLQFAEVDSPMLGDESWAAGGLIQVGGGQAITHAFRLGNTVQSILMYGDVTPPNVPGSLAAAQAALAKAQKG